MKTYYSPLAYVLEILSIKLQMCYSRTYHLWAGGAINLLIVHVVYSLAAGAFREWTS